MNTGKNFKVFGLRSGLIGDSIMSLPILNYLELKYPNSYKYFLIDKKCSQAAACYFNHPLIDKILITEQNEGIGPREAEIARQCDLVINPTPSHLPDYGDSWPNYYNIYEETWRMAGLPLEEYYNLSADQQRPKLEKWFNIEEQYKSIALFPFAGYAKEGKRSPSLRWYKELIYQLQGLGWNIKHFGHFNEEWLASPDHNRLYDNHTDLPFFEQIKMALGCDLTIGTDSGSGLIMGAYEVRQISLLSRHWPGHITNPLAFSTNNPNNQSFIADSGLADDIKIDDVIEAIKSI